MEILLAIFDQINKDLHIVRDRFGVKPLYYSFCENELIFSSEINPILVYFPNKKEMDFQAYHAFLKLGSLPFPLTLFKK